MKVNIIGCGIAGISSAIRMAVRGHQVNVYEKSDGPGGKLSQFEEAGYRFDVGPSIFTMPHFVDELFYLAGKNPRDYFNYKKMETVCHYFWEDGTKFNAYSDIDRLEEEASLKLGVPAGVIKDYLAYNKRKYDSTGRIFLEKSLHKSSTWLSKDVFHALKQVHRHHLFSSMNDLNKKLLQYPRLVQFYNRYATYNGSNPYMASGMLTVIPWLEQGIGVFIPEKGMFHITESLYQLALELGVTFHFNTPVDKIVVDGSKIKGIEISGSFIPSDVVISNMDIWFTYEKLLKGLPKPERILKQEKSTSAIVQYIGIPRTFNQLGLHNVFFSDNYDREFNCLKNGTVDKDPTIYINITSKEVERDAPAGGENWFVMINVPHNRGQDWDTIISNSRENVRSKLIRNLNYDINDSPQTVTVMEPRTIEQKFLSHKGAIYGNASNNMFAAFLRHPNFSRRYKNLYFCGGSAHPGGGIPVCLLSARIVDDLMHSGKN